MLTGRQNAVYRPLVDKAWEQHCSRKNLPAADRSAFRIWYTRQLRTCFGFDSTSSVPSSDLKTIDALCLHFATLTGDYALISYWSSAEERRALWRLERNMETAGVNWQYVRGIARNMGFIRDGGSKDLRDLPAEHILKLSTALFLYSSRRSRKREEVPF